MSKIGFISDVHANKEALTAALKIFYECGVDELICLGDVVGYGPEPLRCLEMVRNTCSTFIQGNHDAAVGDNSVYQRMNNLAMAGIDYARQQLDCHSKEYLAALPRLLTLTDQDITLTHGSLTEDHFDYILNTRSALDNFLIMGTKVLFVGHSHQAFISQLGLLDTDDHSTLSLETFKEQGSVTITLQKEKRTIINPGSIGQPRDVPLGGLCLLDTDLNQVTFIRFPYDIKQTKAKIIEAGLPDYAWERLEKGR